MTQFVKKYVGCAAAVLLIVGACGGVKKPKDDGGDPKPDPKPKPVVDPKPSPSTQTSVPVLTAPMVLGVHTVVTYDNDTFHMQVVKTSPSKLSNLPHAQSEFALPASGSSNPSIEAVLGAAPSVVFEAAWEAGDADSDDTSAELASYTAASANTLSLAQDGAAVPTSKAAMAHLHISEASKLDVAKGLIHTELLLPPQIFLTQAAVTGAFDPKKNLQQTDISADAQKGVVLHFHHLASQAGSDAITPDVLGCELLIHPVAGDTSAPTSFILTASDTTLDLTQPPHLTRFSTLAAGEHALELGCIGKKEGVETSDKLKLNVVTSSYYRPKAKLIIKAAAPAPGGGAGAGTGGGTPGGTGVPPEAEVPANYSQPNSGAGNEQGTQGGGGAPASEEGSGSSGAGSQTNNEDGVQQQVNVCPANDPDCKAPAEDPAAE